MLSSNAHHDTKHTPHTFTHVIPHCTRDNVTYGSAHTTSPSEGSLRTDLTRKGEDSRTRRVRDRPPKAGRGEGRGVGAGASRQRATEDSRPCSPLLLGGLPSPPPFQIPSSLLIAGVRKCLGRAATVEMHSASPLVGFSFRFALTCRGR